MAINRARVHEWKRGSFMLFFMRKSSIVIGWIFSHFSKFSEFVRLNFQPQ